MEEMLVQLMGGRAAEKLFCGNMTTGASDDLNKATKLAYGMIAGYGFSENVGPVNYQQEEESFQKPYSEATGQAIDNEARNVLKKSMDDALRILEENRDKMVQVAELLLARETITSVDMENICGKRKGRSPTSYSEIIRNVEKEKKEEEDKKKSEEEMKTEEGKTGEKTDTF
jgi:ATP-dependent Zn protease